MNSSVVAVVGETHLTVTEGNANGSALPWRTLRFDSVPEEARWLHPQGGAEMDRERAKAMWDENMLKAINMVVREVRVSHPIREAMSPPNTHIICTMSLATGAAKMCVVNQEPEGIDPRDRVAVFAVEGVSGSHQAAVGENLMFLGLDEEIPPEPLNGGPESCNEMQNHSARQTGDPSIRIVGSSDEEVQGSPDVCGKEGCTEPTTHYANTSMVGGARRYLCTQHAARAHAKNSKLPREMWFVRELAEE